MPARDWRRFFILRGRWLLFAIALATGFSLSMIGLELAAPRRSAELTAPLPRLQVSPQPSVIPLRPPGEAAPRSGLSLPLQPPPGPVAPSPEESPSPPTDTPAQQPLSPRSDLTEDQPPMAVLSPRAAERPHSGEGTASPPPVEPVAALAPVVTPRAQPMPRETNGASPRGEGGGSEPAWRRHAVTVGNEVGKPMIAIVIDDMGLDQRRSAAAMALPGPLTLAFMPYGRDLARQTAAARAAGHELIVHVAMQPLGTANDPGPNALMVELPAAEISRRLDWALASFDGYVGINNHMGSRFTTDRAGMDVVMAALKARGLLFLDSRTGQHSVGASTAAAHRVPYAARHIFLDNEISASEVSMQLAETERVARQTGVAVAIGHPHDVTIGVLKAWLPSLAEKNFVLMPISGVVSHLESGRATARSVSAAGP